jgi:two-component system sensor histidine kinase HydH
LYSSIRTFHELDEQRAVYLRQRISLLAARLETLPPGATAESAWEMLSEEEPNLVDLAIISRGSEDDGAALSPMWNGQELFRTEFSRKGAGGLFRAYVPFHAREGLRIARIGLDPAAAEFLLVHARHNVIVASLGGLALVLLSAYAVWAMRRAAKLRVRELEMEHLAHLGKLAAVMAHEIRNPLGTIKGFVQLAGERTDPNTREMLKPVVAETERLERLVRDLLAYGRPPVPVPATVDWNHVAKTLAAHGQHLTGGRDILLHISENAMLWRSDPALLEQILLNLLRNAIESIPAGTPGEVRVEAALDKSDVIISVLDTGSGFSETAIQRMFEPFFTTKAFGTGLGLAITRRLVSSMGGELAIRKRDRGGTAAIIRLPKAARMAAGVVS